MVWSGADRSFLWRIRALHTLLGIYLFNVHYVTEELTPKNHQKKIILLVEGPQSICFGSAVHTSISRHYTLQCLRLGNKSTTKCYWVLYYIPPMTCQSESKKYNFMRLGKVLIINHKNTGGPIPTVSRFQKTYTVSACVHIFYILVIGLVGRYVTRFRRVLRLFRLQEDCVCPTTRCVCRAFKQHETQI